MGDLRLGQSWSRSQRLRNDLLYAVAYGALRLLRPLPARYKRRLGSWLGRLVHLAWPAGRKSAELRLRQAFAGSPPTSARQVFETLGEDLATMVLLLEGKEKADESLSLAAGTCELLTQALSSGKGVVFATAHLGPFEQVASLVARQGFSVSVLARESYDPRFTQLYEQLRRPLGVHTIYRAKPGAELAIVRALRAGHLVGFVMDWAGRGMSTARVQFLGALCDMPLGPARIALRTGASLVVGTVRPKKEGGLELSVEHVKVSDLRAGQDEAVLTQRLATILEARIRKVPQHWPWMHGANSRSATVPHELQDG